MIWHLKQLLPLTYVSEYEELDDDDNSLGHFVTVWRMWFGRCFAVRTWQVVQDG